MKFNQYSHLDGLHAFLSPSSSSWVNYDDERLVSAFNNMKMRERGTELHAYASYSIKNRIKLAPHKKSLNQFVNDAIGYRMESEQILYYSEHCFGTADAISFDETDRLLRIFDLKTGIIQVTFRQLYVYSAIFCLEYNKDPRDFDIELRLYQNNEIIIDYPEKETILDIMDKIKHFDKILSKVASD